MLDTAISEIGTGCVAGSSVIAAGEPLARFSNAENPFLFPLELLGNAEPASDGDDRCNGAGDGAVDDDDTYSNQSGSSWWLLHTKPRQEKKLAEQLVRLDISHYLPAIKCRAVTRGRTRITWSPLFPGYFFLRGTREQRLRALETNRIVATHRVEEGDGLFARLWELADLIEKGAPLTAEARLAKGRKVRVKSGLFENMEGTVIKRGGKTRLFILVNQLLGGVSLEIEEHLLEPLF